MADKNKVVIDCEPTEVISEYPLVIANPKRTKHIHTYGGLSEFFRQLKNGLLMGTICTGCVDAQIWIPPRAHCPDCWKEMTWVPVEPKGKIYSHSTTLYPGEGFKASVPCHLISVEIPGMWTKPMSYLSEGEPYIGMKVKAVFRTKNPTYTILDLSWIPDEA